MKDQIFDAHTLAQIATEETFVLQDGTVVVERNEGGVITERQPTPEEEAEEFRRDVFASLVALSQDATGQRVITTLVALRWVRPRMARLAGWNPPARLRNR